MFHRQMRLRAPSASLTDANMLVFIHYIVYPVHHQGSCSEDHEYGTSQQAIQKLMR